jgi:type VI secretion system protein ImpM
VIGLAGKLPAHGDFVRRGGPVAALLTLDRWLDSALTSYPSPDEAIDRLDGWRFAVMLDERAVIGAIVASHDSVGRRFPLVAILSGSPPCRAAADCWAAAAIATMADARDAGTRADDLCAALDAISRPNAGLDSVASGWWRGDGAPILAGTDLPDGPAFARLIGEDG